MSVVMYADDVTEGSCGMILNTSDSFDCSTGGESYQLKSCIFDIQCEFKMNSEFASEKTSTATDSKELALKRRKRKKVKAEEASHVDNEIEPVFTALMSKAKEAGLFTPDNSSALDNNIKAREETSALGCGSLLLDLAEMPHDISDELDVLSLNMQPEYTVSLFHSIVKSHAKQAATIQLHGRTFLIPANSSFLMSDIRGLQAYAKCTEQKYNFIVIDPPWENKSVKRKKTYNTLSNFDLFKLPVKSLSAPECMIALWCTNKPSQHTFISEKLLPAWGFVVVAKWYWIKVTQSGQPIRRFGVEGKKPYEMLMVCIKAGTSAPEKLPNKAIIITVPSLLHSAKPPLNKLFSRWLPDNRQCLELFARNLLPNFMSWGNEVLSHQDIDYYEKVS